MKKLSLVDFSFLSLETEATPMHVGSLQIFELPAERDQGYIDELVQFYGEIFSETPPFNHKLSKPFLNLGMPEWQKVPNFNATTHIERHQLPAPGDQTELDALVSKLNRPLLDREKPLWRVFVIEGLAEDRVAIYFKIHHASIDGIGGVRLMQTILQKKKPGEAAPKPLDTSEVKSRVQKIKPRPQPKGANMGKPLSTMERLVDGLQKEWNHWGEVFGSYQTSLEAAAKEDEDYLPQPYTCPPTVLNGRLTPQRSFAFRSISLHEIKEIRKKLKVTANDVVLAICGGGLRRYLQAKNALPEKPLVTLVPVSVRSKAGGASGNELTFMLVNLATHVEDPRRRLEIIAESSTRGKELLGKMSRTAIKRHASLFSSLSIFAKALNLDRLAPPFNVLVSNVPASRDILYVKGSKLEHLHPVSFLYETQGLNITIVSYEYNMDFAFLACDSLIPDVGMLADFHLEAFEEIKQLTG